MAAGDVGTHVVVVGAGVFGAWSAHFLVEAGWRVTLVDAYGPANGRASSSDHSRVIRAGYGADATYSRWATDARRDWDWLAGVTRQHLVTPTGALFLGEPGNGYVRATLDTLVGLGLAAEWIEPAHLAARYPQIGLEGLGPAVYEPGAGVIRARAAVQALVHWLVRERGVQYVVAQITPLDEQQPSPEVRTRDRADLPADAYVFACGPWLPQLFPQAIGARIRATRQEVLYFGVPAGQTQFAASQMPVWIDFAAGLYGIPDLDAQGFKVGIDRHGPPVDPDALDRMVEESVVASARQALHRRFPGLTGAPLVDARVCQYENTSSGDLLIDRHPAWGHCWLVGGGSGHGFKHGPSVGRHVAALLNGETPVMPRFALARKQVAASRAIY